MPTKIAILWRMERRGMAKDDHGFTEQDIHSR